MVAQRVERAPHLLDGFVGGEAEGDDGAHALLASDAIRDELQEVVVEQVLLQAQHLTHELSPRDVRTLKKGGKICQSKLPICTDMRFNLCRSC